MTQTDTRGAGGAGLRWCALCGAEYVQGVLECAECQVTLVDAPPLRVDEVGDEQGDQLAYELADVEAAERLAIDRDLAERGIVHAWDGTTLVVAPYDEADVDAVLAGADAAFEGLEELGDDEDQVVYEVADLDVERRTELSARLAEQGIAHGFDERGDLVVLASDEDAVDAILDEVEFPDQLEADHTPGEGLDAVDTMGALFVAADRLAHDPSDADAVLEAADAARTMATMAPPYGFEAKTWEGVVEAARELLRLLETEAELIDDDAVAEQAATVRSVLRPLV